MRYSVWKPLYEEILDDFGFDWALDHESAIALSKVLAGSDRAKTSDLRRIIKGRVVTVFGGAATVADSYFRSHRPRPPIIAADGIISLLLRHGIVPDVICTDLDGDISSLKKANAIGSIAIIHAHGDNIRAIRKHAGDFKGKVMGSAQCRPMKYVHNFGGFTDGDRCVFLANHFGAGEIQLVAFDFKHPYKRERVLIGPEAARKRKKLEWAERLISLFKNVKMMPP